MNPPTYLIRDMQDNGTSCCIVQSEGSPSPTLLAFDRRRQSMAHTEKKMEHGSCDWHVSLL